MKKVKLNEGYYYLPENNTIINEETLNQFNNQLMDKKIDCKDFHVDVDEIFLRKQVKNIKQTVFGVTEDCNLQCSYCVFNKNYLYERGFSKKCLDFETSKVALEYIYGFIKGRFDKVFTISFFGGEPFINFELIRNIVAYSKELFVGWELLFNTTTNGTLLKDEIIKFLIDENFKVLISFDGPQINHDSKRVFKNGRGTFNAVYKNLKKIKENNLEFYNNNISFNIVHSFDLSFKEIFDFFNEDDLIKKNKVTYCQVALKDTDYYEKFPYDEAPLRIEFKLLFDSIINKCKNSIQLTPFEKSIFQNFFTNKDLNLKPKNIFFGTCFFDTRLFIDSEGNFHLCEGINDKLPIGNVKDGWNFKRMVEIVKEFENLRKKHCLECDICYLCKPCYVVFAAGGTLKIDESFCTHLKTTKIMTLNRLIHFEEVMNEGNVEVESKVYRFHQFIFVEKGPKNSAIVDFLNGDIYHVPTLDVNHFESGKYDLVPEFLNGLKELNLIIHVKNNTWIPKQKILIEDLRDFDEMGKNNIILCVEEGVDVQLLKRQVSNFQITRIIYYGSNKIDDLFPDTEIIYETLDFLKCSSLSVVKKDDFVKADEESYTFNHICNNCWGHKIAVTKDGKIRPCIYSTIIIDDLKNLNNSNTIEKIKSYWYITKDNVEKCKECELKYFCIDCREIAQRENNSNLYATNPNCKYNPHMGVWQDE